MLFLTRNLKDEGITVVSSTGEKLKFYIMEVRGSTVRLGFETFKGFEVWRSEVMERKSKEKG